MCHRAWSAALSMNVDGSVQDTPCEPSAAGEQGRRTAGLPGARLQRVTQYIDGNLHRALRLAELSSVVHMSPFHFARLFKERTSVSPHRYVIRRRIDHAMTMLTADGRAVESIARTVGFRSAAHFTTTFRRVVGVTPSEYRRARSSATPDGAPEESAVTCQDPASIESDAER